MDLSLEQRGAAVTGASAVARVRSGALLDIDALAALETRVFTSDQLSRRSLRRFLQVATTETVVVEDAGGIPVGYAMTGFRKDSRIGRIFSLAVDPAMGRRGLGRALLAASEAAAWRRGCTRVQLEVRADNAAAIALYETSGYHCFGRFDDYYEDGTAALRFGKDQG